MADNNKKYTMSDFNKQMESINRLHEDALRIIEEEKSSMGWMFELRKKLNKEQEKYNQLLDLKKQKQDLFNEILASEAKVHGNTKKAIVESINKHDKEIKVLKRKLKVYNAINRVRIDTAKLGELTDSGFSFLMEADKSIKSINLELGLANQNAINLRSNFQRTAGYAASLGATVSDLADIQRSFTEETGRAVPLSEEMLKNVVAIGKGTGLGVQNASLLAGQLELMGVYGSETLKYIQGIVDTSERMGVNSTKVLKNISSNFKSLQKYTFRGGVKAMAEMAQHAEKFKYDIGSMLDSAENARTLEGAVKLAAELQVMGGEFAKTDPFEMLFLSRNDPDRFAKKINNMTKGIATFRKNADGTFESFISPVDIDRLEKVGKSLGMQRGELVEQARRMNEISTLRQRMIGMGFSNKEKELISNVAKFNTETGKYMVQVGLHQKHVSKLTENDLKLLTTQKKTLEARAKEAQTFDEALKNTILNLKSALLPALNGVNAILTTIRPITDKFGELVNTFTNERYGAMAFVGGLMTAAFTWRKIITPMKDLILSKATNTLSGGAGGSKTPKIGAANTLAKGKAAKAAGIGRGVASAGIGVGVGAAALGIGQLAESMAKLDKTQIWALPVTLIAMAGGIAAIGFAGTTAAPGLLAVGGAVGLVGAGIGIASAGVGYMAKGLSELVSSANQSEGSLTKLAGGIVAINSAMALGGVTALFGGAGLIGLRGTLASIAKHSGDLQGVGESFKNISVVMDGDVKNLKDIENTIKSISKISLDKNAGFANLAKAFDKPLKVEFENKEVSLVTNVNLEVDGNKLARATFKDTQKIMFNTKFGGNLS